MYSKFLVSTKISSPASINGGTCMLKPLSNVAGLYEDENNYFFMDPKSFEQIEIAKDKIGDKGKLLTEKLEVSVSFYNENAISVELPKQINCKIESTDATVKGQTISSSYKPAILDNGLSIQVPPFIETGDEIVVDTRNLEYIKKI